MIITGCDFVHTFIIIFSHIWLASSSVTHVTIQMYDKWKETVLQSCTAVYTYTNVCIVLKVNCHFLLLFLWLCSVSVSGIL